ncbi:MAG: HD domain-containing protein [Thermaurantiacus sp.]
MNDSREDGLLLVIRAAEFAAAQHRTQRRKDGETPYINHPLGLMRVLAEEGGVRDPELLAAAALHDVVEDCGVAPETLEALFGPRVAAIVAEVTDDTSLPKAERKRRQVEKVPHLSHEACLLKLADKISNLTDILESPPADWPVARKEAYFAWAGEVVDAMGAVHPVLLARFRTLRARVMELQLPA